MEQRPLRLGDIVDDYCPRERRLTNHAIVALVGEGIRQTRCTTCDAEHVYKNGREPRRRKKDDETLFDQVLADVTEGQLVAAKAPEPAAAAAVEAEAEAEVVGPMHRATHRPPVSDKAPEAPAIPETPANNDQDAPATEDHPADHWPANRQLIRAALPRIDGEPPVPRVIPEFTMHQRTYGRGGRPARFGGGGGGGGGGPERNGNIGGGGGGPRGGGGWAPRGPSNGGPPRGSGGGDGQGQGEGGGRSGRRRGRHKRSRPQ